MPTSLPTEQSPSPDARAVLEEELAWRAFQLQTLQDLARNIGPLKDLDELLHAVLLYVTGALGVLRGFAFLYDQRDRIARASPWLIEKKRLDGLAAVLESDHLEVLESMTEPQRVAGEDMPVLDVDADLADAGIQVWVPLNHERVIGGIGLGERVSGAAFVQDDLDLLETIAANTRIALENARRYEQVQQENVYLRNEVQRTYRFEELIGTSPAMTRVYDLMDKVLRTDTSVLLLGETGTGKELVARAIHYNGPRKNRLFVPQNCAELPENLLESELFGHKRGAFTGATFDKRGLFEVAHEGAIFLDEIGDTSPEVQVRLLRVLQEGEIRPVGGSQWKQVDVRVISATNVDLDDAVEKGLFRRDLYYRLAVFPITIPPLRARKEDIPLLADHFLGRYAEKKGISVRGFTSEALDALTDYPFPGNVRELENEVQRAVVLAEEGDIIGLEHLSAKMRQEDGVVGSGH